LKTENSNGPLPPSGVQYQIARGAHAATVTEVGASLREYTVDGVAVIDGFDVDERSSAGRGQVLAPWPNRLDHGRYVFEGTAGHAALDEPELSNAIHGMVRWMPWHLVTHSTDLVELGCVLNPQPGYPWHLELRVEYRLGEDGLTVTAAATNRSGAVIPFGIGFHPYLTAGNPTVDTARLLLPALRRLETDGRGLPVREVEVAGTEFDFTTPRLVGPVDLDTAYTGLVRDADGRARIELDEPDGRRVQLWVDEAFRYVMAYTGDTLQPVGRRRKGIAIEPMTCPPNALASGRDVIRLDQRQAWSGRWGITTG
jgi:aldose 1-epimerase